MQASGEGKEALLVAHGSPADPAPQEAVMMALAVRVAMWLPGWQVRGATLASSGSLDQAVSRMRAPLVYPFFMAQGWFTRTTLPKRLEAAGATGLHQLAPFGTDPALPRLMVQAARAGAQAGGLDPGRTCLLIAAHGSKVSRTSADSTWAMVDQLREKAGFASVQAGFVEEAPFLAETATGLGRAICLPFFALSAGHVVDDVPDALAQAGFDGILLPPIGENVGVAPLIATALLQAHRRDAPTASAGADAT